MRQGGDTYYALDVTDPSAASYPGYLWEFPAENAAASLTQYVAQTWGTPVLTKIKVKIGLDDNGGQGYERWVMVVTGSYDPSGDPNNTSAYNALGTKGRAIALGELTVAESNHGAVTADGQALVRWEGPRIGDRVEATSIRVVGAIAR